MKKKIIIIATIYLLGCYCSYKIGKQHLSNWDKEIGSQVVYSESDRVFNLGLSVFSWLSFIAFGLHEIIDSADDNKPANW